VAQIRVRRPDQANIGLDPDSFFFTAFDHSKKGVKQKEKEKANSQGQMGPSFSLPRCAAFGEGLFSFLLS
jgi:hypothetical protein